MFPSVRRVGIVCRRGHGEPLERARALIAWLKERGLEVMVEDTGAELDAPQASGQDVAACAELLVVLGGDGTLIHAASLLDGRQIPVFGVNLGSLGFMTEVPVAESEVLLERVIAGDYLVSRRMKLKAQLLRGGKTLLEREVLNDVVISKGALARIADLDAEVDGNRLTVYKADGVVVATPTGSTAYSLAAQGPIVHPSLEAIVLCPICPHALTQRPIVIPPEATLSLQLTSDNGEVFLTLDGQSGLPMSPGDVVRVRRAPAPLLLVRNPEIDYYAILRKKLRWGER